jgi:hypothetical protein
MIDFQSSATALQPCPPGTSENSPAIHGWVHRPLKTQSPAGTAEIIIGFSDLKCRSVFIGLPAEAQRRWVVQAFPFKVPQGQSRPIKAIQDYPNLFKGFWENNFFLRPIPLEMGAQPSSVATFGVSPGAWPPNLTG